MKSKLTIKDRQLLSAYLDGQLSSLALRKLEKRLETSQELLAELESLRRTRVILRSLPQRGVPYNFTLTPAMVKSSQRPQSRLFPILSFSSAFALFIIMVSFIIELVPGLAVGPMSAPLITEEQLSVAKEMQIDETLTPMIILLEEKAPQMEGMGAEERVDRDEKIYPSPSAGLPGPTFMAEESAEMQEEKAIEAQPPAEPVIELAESEEEHYAAEDSISEVEEYPAPTTISGEEMEPTQPRTTVEQPPAQPTNQILYRRFFQAILVLVALITGFAAFYIKRMT